MKNVAMYSTWPKDSFVELAKRYVAGANGRGHKINNAKFYQVVPHAPGCLKFLTPKDRLYIMGHGRDQVKFIAADGLDWDEGFRKAGYSSYQGPKGTDVILKHAELVAKINEAGLSPDFVDIRLWVCKGGHRDFSDFGWEFTGELLKTFKSARVTAYSGFLVLRPNTGRKAGQATENDAAPSEPAQKFRMVVNDDQFFDLYQ